MFRQILSAIAVGGGVWLSLELLKAFDIPFYYALFFYSFFFTCAVYYEINKKISSLAARSPFEHYSNIIESIDYGDLHVPKHSQAKRLKDGGAIPLFITEEAEIIFADFERFGTLFNDRITGRWCIEELGDTNLTVRYKHGAGRQYNVWYGACLMGSLKVTSAGIPDSLRPIKPLLIDKGSRPEANIYVELNYLRFVPFEDAVGFLSCIYMFIGDYDAGANISRWAFGKTKSGEALTSLLWEAMREPERAPVLTIDIQGRYEYLRILTAS